MNYFINKNLLIDDLLELELTYNDHILIIFEELTKKNDYTTDINLFEHIIILIENIIIDTHEYLYSSSISELEYYNIFNNNYINKLNIAIEKIRDFIMSINEINILSDLMSEL